MYEAARIDSRFQPALAVTPRPGADGPGSARFVAELLKAGLEALPTDREAATPYISRACSALLEGLEQSGSSPNTSLSVRGGLVTWQVKRIKAVIEANLEKQLSVRELASVVRLGPGHFQRAFRKSFGVSPHAYVVGQRIVRAQEVMLQSNAPLAEIALAVGFSDQAHLTTRFRREVGVTPAVWRRERKETDHTDTDIPRPGSTPSKSKINVLQRERIAA